jgi:ATP-dependent RNA helicase DeaD
VHRIGRTGRAGRSGEAILFIAPRERNMLRLIERATRQPIEAMTLPSVDDVNARRVAKFKERLQAALAAGKGEPYRAVIESFVSETGADLTEVAAALTALAQGKASLLLTGRDAAPATLPAVEHDLSEPAAEGKGKGKGKRAGRFEPQDTYCLQVGSRHGVQPGHIVGLLANEADLHGSQINAIDIHADHTFVRLPQGMPEEVFRRLQKLKLKGQVLHLSRVARPQRKQRS